MNSFHKIERLIYFGLLLFAANNYNIEKWQNITIVSRNLCESFEVHRYRISTRKVNVDWFKLIWENVIQKYLEFGPFTDSERVKCVHSFVETSWKFLETRYQRLLVERSLNTLPLRDVYFTWKWKTTWVQKNFY